MIRRRKQIFSIIASLSIGAIGLKMLYNRSLRLFDEKQNKENKRPQGLLSTTNDNRFQLGTLINEYEYANNKASYVQIKRIRKGTVAAQNNLKCGDIIKEVDGIKIQTIDDLRKAINLTNEKNKEFKIVRDSVEIVMNIAF